MVSPGQTARFPYPAETRIVLDSQPLPIENTFRYCVYPRGELSVSQAT